MNYSFIRCAEMAHLAGFVSMYDQLQPAYENARQARAHYGQSKAELESGQQSKRLKSDDPKEAEEARNELVRREEQFLSAKLSLFASFAPLFKAAQRVQKDLSFYIVNGDEAQMKLMLKRGLRLVERPVPELMPYHLDIWRINTVVLAKLLQQSFALLGDEAFNERYTYLEEKTPPLKTMLGSASIMPFLPEPDGARSALSGLFTWFAKLMNGHRILPYHVGREDSYPKAMRDLFERYEWHVEPITTEESGDCYVLTPPKRPYEPPAERLVYSD